MAQNLISAELPAQDATEVLQHLADIKTKLNFLLSLQTSDIVSIFKVGNAYLPFVDLAYQALEEHPEIIPAAFDKAEFVKDYALLKAMSPIVSQLNELVEGIQKTFTAVGSDSLNESLDVYEYVKQNKDKVPGLKVIADKMATFFKKTKARTSTPKK